MEDKCQCQVKAHHADKGCTKEAIGTMRSERIKDGNARLCLACVRHFSEHVSRTGDTVAVVYPNGEPSW